MPTAKPWAPAAAAGAMIVHGMAEAVEDAGTGAADAGAARAAIVVLVAAVVIAAGIARFSRRFTQKNAD